MFLGLPTPIFKVFAHYLENPSFSWKFHKNNYNFFLHSQKSSDRYHLSVKFCEEQLCRTLLSREKSFRGSKIDFFDRNPFFFIEICIKMAITFFLHSQKSTARCHFKANFYEEQLCRASLSRGKSFLWIKIYFCDKNHCCSCAQN